MPDRKSLVTTLWLASALALLASVMVAPIRVSSAFAADSSRPAGLARHFFAPHPGQPTTFLGAETPSDPVQRVSALPSEIEEQDRADALDEPRVSFLIPSSLRKLAERQTIAPRSIPSLYPLRC